jgi:predicted outer membrane protein
LLLLSSGAGFAQQEKLPVEAEGFARQAAISNLFELKAAELARQRGKGKQVLDFAERMRADHSRAGKELAEAARKDGAKLTDALDKESEEKLAALGALQGGDFDPAYLSSQVTAHESAVELFGNYAEHGQAGALKAFAEATYPTLRTHLIKVQSLTGP